ncbi:MAG: hypothetical protein AB7F96_22230 [Beijerinckiaceae bacterium]
MFFGAVPAKCIEQIFRLCDFRSWREVFVCCSGGFRIERALLDKYPELQVFSNDVSLYSTALGQALAGREMPITFKGPLEFLEEFIAPDDYIGRVAGVLIASDISRYAMGKPSPYKTKHLKHFRDTMPARIDSTKERIEAMAKACPIADYSPVDWRVHVDHAIERGAGIAAFPPFFLGDYESQFKFMHANIEWPAPSYDLYDPRQLESIVARIRDSGVPYCVLSDQLFKDQKPVMEYVQGRKVPHYCYASTARSSLRHVEQTAMPTIYKRVDLARVTAKSKVSVVPCDYRAANYIKDIYLQKTITHTPGMFNYFVYIDDMLAGALVYSMAKYQAAFPAGTIYLLSDVTTSREAKLSKLVARMACCQVILDQISAKLLDKIGHVLTTARSDHPVSMKYRGIYNVHNRKETDTPGERYIINYIAAAIPDTPDDIFKWWWTKWGRAAVEQAANRDKAA